jgi:raffinose/stachyose/melibiose transport system substrate-binding protein
MKRKIIALLLSLVALSAFAQGTKAKIEFFQQKVEATGTYGTLIDAFQKANPGVTIVQNTVPDPGTVIVTRMSSGDTPEIFSDYPTQMSFRPKVSAGYIRDLTGQPFLSRVNPALLEMSRLPDGKFYALPISQNFGGIYYHRDIFAKYGIAIPRTYTDLIAACKKLKANGVTPFIFPDKSLGQLEHSYLISSGSIYPNFLKDLRKVKSGEKKLSDFPRFRRVAEVFLELRSYGTGDSLAVSYPASAESFANKSAAMTILGSYAFTTMKKANPDAQIAMFPFP